jgi:hypothetical protein
LVNDGVSSNDISEIEERAGRDAEIHLFHVVAQFSYDTLRADEEFWRTIVSFGLRQNDEEAHTVKEGIRGRMDMRAMDRFAVAILICKVS